MTEAKAAETAQPNPQDERAALREQARREGVRMRDLARGYEEIAWSGRTLYRPLGGGDRTFDSEADCQEWVRAHAVMYDTTGGVTP